MAKGEEIGLGHAHVSVLGNKQILLDLWVGVIRAAFSADHRHGSLEISAYDLIVLPGGIPGAQHLRDAPDLIRMLKRQKENGKLYGAICASPAIVLDHHGLLVGHQATCHPGFAGEMNGQHHIDERVVLDGNCLTSRGAGTAVEFARALVETLYDEEKRKDVAGGLAL